MNTQHPLKQEETKDPPNIQPDDITFVVPLAPVSEQASPTPPASDYYILEDDGEEEPESGINSQFARPFQLSTGMPVLQTEQNLSSGQVPPPVATKKTAGVRPRFLRIVIIAALVVATTGFLWMTVFAQPAQPLTVSRGTPMTSPTPKPTPTFGTTLGNTQGGDWVPQQLPANWTAAGLSNGDALFAERTAWTFTDREEGLDFRNVGTRADHGGTFTASVFILSPDGKTRFFQNDIRVINNTLFDHVQKAQLIQAAVNAIPRLVQFQVQGQNAFAWVDVSFQLYQSQVNPTTGQRIEGLEMDPATNQPRTHRMSVLLIRVPPNTQKEGAPMGGTGWLVSSYDLDLQSGALAALVQSV